MNDLNTLEKTVIDYLSSQLKSINIKQYNGEFDANASDRLSFKTPSLFISFLGGKPAAIADGSLSIKSNWVAFLVLSNNKKQHLSTLLNTLNLSSLGLSAVDIELVSFEQILARQLDKKKLTAWVIRWKHDLKILTPVAGVDFNPTSQTQHNGGAYE